MHFVHIKPWSRKAVKCLWNFHYVIRVVNVVMCFTGLEPLCLTTHAVLYCTQKAGIIPKWWGFLGQMFLSVAATANHHFSNEMFSVLFLVCSWFLNNNIGTNIKRKERKKQIKKKKIGEGPKTEKSFWQGSQKHGCESSTLICCPIFFYRLAQVVSLCTYDKPATNKVIILD